MVVVGDVELLLGHVVSLPDIQRLTVGAQVGAKVDTVLSVGKFVRRDTNLGAAAVIDPLLEGEVGIVFWKAVASGGTGGRTSRLARTPKVSSYLQCNTAAIPELRFGRTGDRIDLETKLRTVALSKPSDGSSHVGRHVVDDNNRIPLRDG